MLKNKTQGCWILIKTRYLNMIKTYNLKHNTIIYRIHKKSVCQLNLFIKIIFSWLYVLCILYIFLLFPYFFCHRMLKYFSRICSQNNKTAKSHRLLTPFYVTHIYTYIYFVSIELSCYKMFFSFYFFSILFHFFFVFLSNFFFVFFLNLKK